MRRVMTTLSVGYHRWCLRVFHIAGVGSSEPGRVGEEQRPTIEGQRRTMTNGVHRLPMRRMIALAVSVVAMFGMFAVATPAKAQNDPYTGGGVQVEVQIQPGVFISVTVAVPGQRIRIQGCLFRRGALVRVTLNLGSNQSQGRACPRRGGNALGEPVNMQLIGVAPTATQRVLLQTTTSTTVPPCAFDHPNDAGPPDTSSDGGFAASNAGDDGCLDTFVTVPDKPPGQYELCTVSPGVQTVCAVVQIASSSKVLGNSFFSAKGFARTGIYVIPLVLLGLAAIIIGRTMVRRSRRDARMSR